VPDEIEFKTKLEIAREQIEWRAQRTSRWRRADGMQPTARMRPCARVRRDLGLKYAVASVQERWSHGQSKKETSAEALALDLPKAAMEDDHRGGKGSAETVRSRFRPRAREALRRTAAEPIKPERMAADRVAEGRGEADQVLALHLERNIAFDRLVDITMMRWRIERDISGAEARKSGSVISRGEDGWASDHHGDDVHRRLTDS